MRNQWPVSSLSMTLCATFAALLTLSGPASAHTLAELLPGIYTNTEQAYFQGEAGEEADDRLSLQMTAQDDGTVRLTTVDSFGESLAENQAVSISTRDDLTALEIGECTRLFRVEGEDFVLAESEGSCDSPATMTRISDHGIALTWPDGRVTDLRRARPVSCWISVKRDEPDGNGEESWTFDSGLMMHDQGGHIRAGGGDSGAPEVIVRMRNVVWPEPTTNRPSLVIYVHRPDDLVRAVSYSWANQGAERVGINLRWMQVSCTIQNEETGDTEE